MADITIGGDLPTLATANLTTTAQIVAIPPRARAVYVIEATADLQYSFDGTTYADAPAAAGFLVWSREQKQTTPGGDVVYLKLSSGTATVRLDVRDHL